MFHACTLTLKCQNYDPSRVQCFKCEQRVAPASNLQGYVAEGVYTPDLQYAQKVITEYLGRPMVNLDGDAQKIDPLEITDNYENFTKATEALKAYNAQYIPNARILW